MIQQGPEGWVVWVGVDFGQSNFGHFILDQPIFELCCVNVCFVVCVLCVGVGVAGGGFT